MNRRGSGAIAANPVLIGAATTLVILVAVFLAYNANNGLPFVPTYQLKAVVPSAANLVKGNEVRIGGTRVGVVDQIKPLALKRGRYAAELDLKLQTSVRPLPVDSTILIRPRSALGLKYVEITKGTSRHGFADGATVPISRAQPRPVEIDEVLNTFDEKTRQASRVNLLEIGDALTGRGTSLNTAIRDFNPLLRDLVPVMRNLSSPKTHLATLFQALERTASIVAPVAQTQANLFQNLDTTFNALSQVTPQIEQTITGGPPALQAAITNFPQQRPFLANSQRLFAELRPGVHALKPAASDLADAFEIGKTTLRRSVQLSNRLGPVFLALQRFAEDPLVSLGIKDLTTTARDANPVLSDLQPLQTVCNYLTLWFRNASSLLSEGDRNGTWQRFIVIAAPTGPNNEGGPSSAPANGPGANYLHSNPYPNTPGGGRTDECEAGNEPWLPGRQVIGNVPGNQGTKVPRTTRDITK